jgi:hypothetical protein
VTNLKYSDIVFGVLASVWIFNDLLPLIAWAGILVIVGSGIAATILRTRAVTNAPHEEHQVCIAYCQDKPSQEATEFSATSCIENPCRPRKTYSKANVKILLWSKYKNRLKAPRLPLKLNASYSDR